MQQAIYVNGKTRRNHELSHEPPVQADYHTLVTTSSLAGTTPPKQSELGDNVYNYNCALMTVWFSFLQTFFPLKKGWGADHETVQAHYAVL